jgi:hypothetical protein
LIQAGTKKCTSFLKHRSRNAVTKDDASDDESSDEDKDDDSQDDRRVVTLLLAVSAMKMLGKYLVSLTPKEKIPPAIHTVLETIWKECDRVPELEMEIKELKTNLNIVKLSKKAKKGKVSPAHENMLREANSAVKENVCHRAKFPRRSHFVYSENPKSICRQIVPCISWPTDCTTTKHKKSLWTELIMPGLTRMFTQARNNITQAMRTKYNSKKLCTPCSVGFYALTPVLFDSQCSMEQMSK